MGSRYAACWRAWSRYSAGVRPLSFTWRLCVFQCVTKASRSALKLSKVCQSWPQKNSSLRCPKTCSVAPLSMQLPVRDMLWMKPLNETNQQVASYLQGARDKSANKPQIVAAYANNYDPASWAADPKDPSKQIHPQATPSPSRLTPARAALSRL